jgi:hypothetical protein
MPKCKCGREIKIIGYKELANILEWDPRKLSVYKRRGSLPEPDFQLAAGPVWLADNRGLKKFIKKHKKTQKPDLL